MNNRTLGITLGAVMFATGLLLHIVSYTKQIPPEKRLEVRYLALALMIIGGTMAMVPLMMPIVRKGPPF